MNDKIHEFLEKDNYILSQVEEEKCIYENCFGKKDNYEKITMATVTYIYEGKSYFRTFKEKTDKLSGFAMVFSENGKAVIFDNVVEFTAGFKDSCSKLKAYVELEEYSVALFYDSDFMDRACVLFADNKHQMKALRNIYNHVLTESFAGVATNEKTIGKDNVTGIKEQERGCRS